MSAVVSCYQQWSVVSSVINSGRWLSSAARNGQWCSGELERVLQWSSGNLKCAYLLEADDKREEIGSDVTGRSLGKKIGCEACTEKSSN